MQEFRINSFNMFLEKKSSLNYPELPPDMEGKLSPINNLVLRENYKTDHPRELSPKLTFRQIKNLEAKLPPSYLDNYPPNVLKGFKEMGAQGWTNMKDFLLNYDEAKYKMKIGKLRIQ
jgi:hypothetical protein